MSSRSSSAIHGNHWFPRQQPSRVGALAEVEVAGQAVGGREIARERGVAESRETFEAEGGDSRGDVVSDDAPRFAVRAGDRLEVPGVVPTGDGGAA